jgi:hypothetical protein
MTAPIPDGYAMSPPDLAGDTPVLDVFEPVFVGFRPVGGMEFDVAVAKKREGFWDVRIFEEPLEAEARLDGDISALAEADGVFVGLLFFQQPALLQHFGGAFARVEAVEAVKFGSVMVAGIVDLAVRREDVDDGQVAALADFVVGLVMRGRDLEHASAEAFFDGIIGDDGDGLAMERAHCVTIYEVIPLPARFYGEGDIGHDGFGARGGDD